MNILIVDDEPLARDRLDDLVTRIGGHRVVDVARNGREAIRACERWDVDVVLLDIEMPGMGGLEAASILKSLDRSPVVIFCTAYDEHAIAAFDASAVDYLLKPVRSSRLAEALERAARFVAGGEVASTPPAPEQRTHLCARLRGSLELVAIADVICLLAEDKYVVVVHDQGEVLIEDSLISLESEFSGQFVRVHRSALVAPDSIESLSRTDGRSVIGLAGTTREVEVSRRNLARIRKLIKQL